MILGELLDAHVLDDAGRRLGYVVDVRLVLDGPAQGLLAAPRVHGVLVSPRTGSSFLGYERRDVRAPALLARWLRRRHRGTFLVLWPDVARVDDDHVVLRAGYRRWSPVLDG
jgi:hypothetical protein